MPMCMRTWEDYFRRYLSQGFCYFGTHHDQEGGKDLFQLINSPLLRVSCGRNLEAGTGANNTEE